MSSFDSSDEDLLDFAILGLNNESSRSFRVHQLNRAKTIIEEEQPAAK